MYGDLAKQLIRSLTRETVDIIPKYQAELVDRIIKENDELYAENLKSSESENVDENEIMVMQVRHTAKLWNKRCIIAYHFERLKRIKNFRWDYGNNLPKEIIDNLSKNELEWFTKYNDNLFNYMSSLNNGEGLDLTLYQNPPKKLYVQVKCLRDYGEFDLDEEKPVMLKKDSIHYLPLKQCEKLIDQGVLEPTSWL